MLERARLGDVTIAWDEAGDVCAPALLVLHGFTGHRDDFVDLRRELSATRRVITPDLRGHGASGRASNPASYTFDGLIEDSRQLLAHLGLGTIDLLGHSFGGMVALRFALTEPARVRSLTLAGTSPEAPTGVTLESLEPGIRIALEHGMDELQRRAEAAGRRRHQPWLEGWADAYWQHHARRYREMSPAAYAGLARTMATQAPVTPRLAEIRCPTLIVVGEHDTQFLAGAALLEQGIPGAKRVTLPNAGHHPHQEARAAFVDALRQHLDGITPATLRGDVR
jgi:3-oxoadipate enol-lactonase/2-succinyl-6-hydroxy-2,4-cyclohexadiene-1-carboxylate synthase